MFPVIVFRYAPIEEGCSEIRNRLDAHQTVFRQHDNGIAPGRVSLHVILTDRGEFVVDCFVKERNAVVGKSGERFIDDDGSVFAAIDISMEGERPE